MYKKMCKKDSKKYISVVDAYQWHSVEPYEGKIREIDHLRLPSFIDNDKLCSACSKPLKDHGYMENSAARLVVCPGDYIVTNNLKETFPISAIKFESTRELYSNKVLEKVVYTMHPIYGYIILLGLLVLLFRF